MRAFVLLCLVAWVYADVSHILNPDQKAQIKSQSLNVDPDGSYQWSFDTENGIQAQAQGEVVQVDPETVAQKVAGNAGWISPEGEPVSFSYVADENGYQVQGSHLPTPPPIPEAIIRSLEYIRAHPPQPEK